MADASILKEFLVSLGFQVDGSSERKFAESGKKATELMKEFGATMTAVSTVAVAGIIKIASSLEDLYFASQRTKASAENIKAYEYAVSQLGGSAEGARGSLESLARNLRNAPGYYGMLEGLGVHTEDANHQLRDTVDIMGDLGNALAKMPYYQANSYANALGIDERTLMAMRDGSLTAQMEKYRQMREAFGLGGNTGTNDGHAFMSEMRDLGAEMLLLLQKIGITAAQVMLPAIRLLNAGIMTAVEWFGSLDSKVKNVLKVVGLLVAAWTAMVAINGIWTKLNLVVRMIDLAKAVWGLNVAMLANPIGLIVAAVVAFAAALALLWDDFKVWREGGQSIIDWGAWQPEIDAALNALHDLGDAFAGLLHSLAPVKDAVVDLVGVFHDKLGSVLNWVGDRIKANIKARIDEAIEGIHALASILRGDWGDTKEHAKNIIHREIKVHTEGIKTSKAIAQEAEKRLAPVTEGAKAAAAPVIEQTKKTVSDTMNWARGALGRLISRGEGDYHSVNLGAAHGYRAAKMDLSNMTLDEVMRGQREHQFNAVGRYQLIGSTLRDAAKALHLNGAEKFDAALQDRIFNQYLIGAKRRQIGDYLRGKSNDMRAALKAASQEWASVANPDTGKSFYAGVGNNKASISAAEMTAALNNARAQVLRTESTPLVPFQMAAQPDSANSQPVINQTTNVTVNGATDPNGTARAVTGAQNNVNTLMARNFKTVAR